MLSWIATKGWVEALLRAHFEEEKFLGGPPLASGPTQEPPTIDQPGAQIGPYTLREQIGEGGFGVVYVAEQASPVRRKVALKIVKPGMDTKNVIARFEAERQALALMDHPNIARVLDAGATDSGRPYFVMELVQGVPITEFCDKNSFPTGRRLELFMDVCHAVQHAHHKGIIHRDLKPSNVMVTLHDGKPVPKVIDFGVAKALSQQLTEKTIYTSYGQMIGTPVYMSPEQAEMSGLGIDTRSDIYSLGVLLYELLTGKTPVGAERLQVSGYNEMLRIIRDEEPPRPSTKVTTLGAEATVIARNRQTDPRKLQQHLAGELDWIVMKALEKDRDRRYDTANNFAADIKRFLSDEAVHACPPSRAYLLRKFIARHRGPLAMAVSLFLMLCLGLAGTSLGLFWARSAEDEATRERDRAIAARDAEAEQRLRAEESQTQSRNRLVRLTPMECGIWIQESY